MNILTTFLQNKSNIIMLGTILLVIIVYNIMYMIMYTQLNYNNYYHLKNKFTKNEIKYMQECTNENTNINTDCFKNLHNKLISIVKKSLNKNYLYVGHARFSNNTNSDGQTFHRDIKNKFLDFGPFPDIYTIILYLDPTEVNIGYTNFKIKPGDIIIFNSFSMHKGKGISVFGKKNRRVLQWFHCIFDENEKIEFLKNNVNCEHYENDFVTKYVSKIFDYRFFPEFFGVMGNFANCKGKDKLYKTMINENYYIDTISDVEYYRNL